MTDALLFAFTAALNPTLLTATMVMLFAREPRRLMSGYLLGAYTASLSSGLVIVYALEGSAAVSTTEHTLSPAADIVLGLLLVLVAFVIHGDRDARLRERRAAHAVTKGPREAPRWRQALDSGRPRTAFVVGILLTLPGASFIVGMSRISKANSPVAETVVAVVLFCVIMLLLIEIPLVGFAIRPDYTRRQIGRFTGWVNRNTRTIVMRLALALAGLFLLRATITLLG